MPLNVPALVVAIAEQSHAIRRRGCDGWSRTPSRIEPALERLLYDGEMPRPAGRGPWRRLSPATASTPTAGPHGERTDVILRASSGHSEFVRAFITGGAGFIGSHLAEALLSRRPRGVDPRRSIDGIDPEHRAPERAGRLPLRDRQCHQRAAARGADRRLRRRLPSRRGRRREADRRGAGPHDRDQRARHRGRPPAREQEEEARRCRVDVRGLRQEHCGAVQRRRRPRVGTDAETPLGLRVQQGDRRVPGARLLEGEEAAGDHRRASSIRSGRGRPAATAW